MGKRDYRQSLQLTAYGDNTSNKRVMHHVSKTSPPIYSLPLDIFPTTPSPFACFTSHCIATDIDEPIPIQYSLFPFPSFQPPHSPSPPHHHTTPPSPPAVQQPSTIPHINIDINDQPQPHNPTHSTHACTHSHTHCPLTVIVPIQHHNFY